MRRPCSSWLSVLCVAFIGLGQSARANEAAPARRPNVLFIAVDDLKPTLGCYGDTLVKSPHIDRLAAGGALFMRAYCQQAVCSPSRNSLLTGLRPDTIGIYDLATHFRTKVPNAVTLPQRFKQEGYHSEGMGKIYHTGHGNYDDVHSWSVKSWKGPGAEKAPARAAVGASRSDVHVVIADDVSAPKGKSAADGSGKDADASAKPKPAPKAPATQPRGVPYAAPKVADDALMDGKIANHAVERLRDLATQDKPFFLAVGFLKPHLPFIAPKRYWDLYDPASFKLPAVTKLPDGAPPFTTNNSGELRQYEGVPKQGPISEQMSRELIHGYYAAVSYMDAQVGRVLDELDRLKLADNTIVILWGDHGWHLGDHGIWCKHTNFEQATRVPLIIRAPGRHKPAGAKIEALTEFVDIYPTLCELAGIAGPKELEGTSFAPLLADPARPWKKAAYSQYPRGIPGEGSGMGHSVRTDRYRLTEWTVKGKDYSAVELYDYQADPEETANLAGKPEHAARVAEMKKLLRDWKSARPGAN